MEQHVLNISNISLSHSLTRYIASAVNLWKPADMERVLNSVCGTTPRFPLLLSHYHPTPIDQVHKQQQQQSIFRMVLNGACATTPRIPLLVSTTLSLPLSPLTPSLAHLLLSARRSFPHSCMCGNLVYL